MFNKQNLCHVASNNRNEVKVGVFVYKTTDDLETVLVSGYFNDKIVDINLHDLIIHEWHDPTDRTKVQRNVLCVTERTLDNVGTAVIKSKWEGDIEQEVADLQTYVDNTFVKKAGDTMTGSLTFSNGTASEDIKIEHDPHGAIKITRPDGKGFVIDLANQTLIYPTASNVSPAFGQNLTTLAFGHGYIKHVHAIDLYNETGDLLQLPTEAATLATKAQVDTAANSGDQLTNKGVWYAKMYAATVAPSAEDGTNYADFSQTDGQGNPIIVTYNRVNGAWVQDQTITPPADYNGYVTVTSKIWDIVEQSGQQGGKVLWSHNQKTFTPYPQIISFEDAALSGNSTVAMPLNPTNDNITNKGYVDSAIASALPAATTWDLFDFKWKDCTMSRVGWKLSDGSQINKTDAEEAYAHILADASATTTSYPYVTLVGTLQDGTYVRATEFDEVGADYPYAYAHISFGQKEVIYSTSDVGGSGSTGPLYYGSSSAGAQGWTADETKSGNVSAPTIKFETPITNKTLMYFVAADGHKIVPREWMPAPSTADVVSAQQDIVADIYTATGVAWYYVIDESNQWFILPRTKYAFVGYRDSVGAYVPETLPDHTHTYTKIMSTYAYRIQDFAAVYTYDPNGETGGANHPTYQTDAPVQQRATQMYLYFYIGQ
jgi:hypothetical protein